MALRPKGSFLLIVTVIIATALIWTGNRLSARTRTIGSDRVVSFESLPDGDTCVMPGAESASLTAAIVSMESLSRDTGSSAVCAVPPQAAPHASFSQAPASQTRPAAQTPGAPEHIVGGPGTAYQARTRSGQIDRKAARY